MFSNWKRRTKHRTPYPPIIVVILNAQTSGVRVPGLWPLAVMRNFNNPSTVTHSAWKGLIMNRCVQTFSDKKNFLLLTPPSVLLQEPEGADIPANTMFLPQSAPQTNPSSAPRNLLAIPNQPSKHLQTPNAKLQSSRLVLLHSILDVVNPRLQPATATKKTKQGWSAEWDKISYTFTHYIPSSKEVWKILPSYEELRRGAIGRGKEVEVMSIRCHVN